MVAWDSVVEIREIEIIGADQSQRSFVGSGVLHMLYIKDRIIRLILTISILGKVIILGDLATANLWVAHNNVANRAGPMQHLPYKMDNRIYAVLLVPQKAVYALKGDMEAEVTVPTIQVLIAVE